MAAGIVIAATFAGPANAADQHHSGQQSQERHSDGLWHEPEWAKQDRHNREMDCLQGASWCQQPYDQNRQ